MYVFIFIIIWFNKKIILVNKFIKHSEVNGLRCKIKYLDLYIFLDFSSFIFSYR